MEKVSIIIPAWHEAKTIKQTLQSLLGLGYPKQACEVIVVAGGADGTYDVAHDFAGTAEAFSRYVVVLQEPEGKNAAIQKGLKEARHDTIVLLDADTQVMPRALGALIEPMREGKSDLTIANPEPVTRTWVSDYYLINKLFCMNQISTYSGHAMAFRLDVVRDRLDYFFDKKVKVGVDYLFAKRVRECGMVIRFVQKAKVITCIPSTLRYFLRTELRWAAALIRIDGVRVSSLFRSGAVCGALVGVMPLWRWLFIAALLFHFAFVAKKIHMCRTVSAQRCLRSTSIAGFVLLSYLQHLVNLSCYVRHFLNSSRDLQLYQGER
jgi:cellulose synthase/poly-beta-1,6-N-acetylglucosamine synthase-like glycosyltransferase